MAGAVAGAGVGALLGEGSGTGAVNGAIVGAISGGMAAYAQATANADQNNLFAGHARSETDYDYFLQQRRINSYGPRLPTDAPAGVPYDPFLQDPYIDPIDELFGPDWLKLIRSWPS